MSGRSRTLTKIVSKEIQPGVSPLILLTTEYILLSLRDLATIHHICEGHLEELNDISKENMVQIKTLVTVTEMLSKHKQKYTGEFRKYLLRMKCFHSDFCRNVSQQQLAVRGAPRLGRGAPCNRR